MKKLSNIHIMGGNMYFIDVQSHLFIASSNTSSWYEML
jgi:hypothetical protein